MRDLLIRCTSLLFLVVLPSLPTSYTSAEMQRLRLGDGVGISVPADWTVRLNEAAQRYEIGRQTFKNSTGIDDSSVTVLSAISKSTGAEVKVNVMKNADFTARMYELSPAEVEELAPFIHDLLSRTASVVGITILQHHIPGIVQVNGRSVLVMGYLYAAPAGPWSMAQYKIPAKAKQVSVTFNYPKATESELAPVMLDMLRSVKVD